jgi:hypothetical protein
LQAQIDEIAVAVKRDSMRLIKWLLLNLAKPDRRVFLLSVLFLAAALRLAVVNFISDDAYISFTYARNFASGIGLVFNPGEYIYGYTNPGWTVLASWFFRLFSEQEAIAVIKLLALTASLATVLLLYQLVQKETGNETVARLIVLLVALQPWDIAEALNGLETPAYALFLLASLYFFLRER